MENGRVKVREVPAASVGNVSDTVQHRVHETRARCEDRGLLRVVAGLLHDAEDGRGRRQGADGLREQDHRVRSARTDIRRAGAAFLLRGLGHHVPRQRSGHGGMQVRRRASAVHAALSIRFAVLVVQARGEHASGSAARDERHLLEDTGRQPVDRHCGTVRRPAIHATPVSVAHRVPHRRRLLLDHVRHKSQNRRRQTPLELTEAAVLINNHVFIITIQNACSIIITDVKVYYYY